MTGLGKFAAMANSRRRSREDQQRISAITLAASASGGFVRNADTRLDQHIDRFECKMAAKRMFVCQVFKQDHKHS
jgi:hypothetical protein